MLIEWLAREAKKSPAEADENKYLNTVIVADKGGKVNG